MTNSSKFWKAAIVVFIFYILADFVWHGWLFADFYEMRFAAINGAPSPMTFPPFILAFEVIAALVSTYFVQKTSSTMQQGMWHGGLLGFFSVSAINFVVHSLIPKWDTSMLMVDTLWGIIIGVVGGAIIMWMTNMKKA